MKKKQTLALLALLFSMICAAWLAACGSNDGPVKAQSVTLSQTTAEIGIGEQLALTATVSPTNAADKSITWESSSNAVATVENGIVTGVTVGEAVITAKSHNGKTAICTVNVVIAVESVTISRSTADLVIGDEITLSATVSPDTATNKTVAWESSADSIATVDNGTVTAVGEGEAVITAKSHNGKTATCTVTVSAKPVYTEGLQFEKVADGYAVTGLKTDVPVQRVVIPAKYEDEPVTEIAEDAFESATFTGIEIPSSVKRIGDSAFYDSGLEEVTIPDSVETMGYAFWDAKKLKSVTLGNGLTEIADYTFQGTLALETLNFGGNIQRIGQYAFYLSGIKSLTVPGSVKTIDKGAFYQCDIENITLSEGVETIGQYAFYQSNIQSLVIPDSVTDISTYMCYQAASLKSVKIGAGLETVGSSSFEQTGLTEVLWSDGVKVKTLGSYAFGKTFKLESVVIPDSVTDIKNAAFGFCYSLHSVTIGANVKNISSAFSDDYGLIEVYNRSNLEFVRGTNNAANNAGAYSKNVFTSESKRGKFSTVDEYLFYTFSDGGNTYCYLVGYHGTDTDLSLPTPGDVGVESYEINGYAFWENEGFSGYYNEVYHNIESVVIPNGVTAIGDDAFAVRTNLKAITIGEDVAKLGAAAFKNCNRLKTVNWNAIACEGFEYSDVNGGQKDSFRFCESFDTLIFGNKVQKIPAYMFYYCNKVKSITIPASVIEIGQNAFTHTNGNDTDVTVHFEATTGWKVTSTSSPVGTVETPNFSSADDIRSRLVGAYTSSWIWTRT